MINGEYEPTEEECEWESDDDDDDDDEKDENSEEKLSVRIFNTHCTTKIVIKDCCLQLSEVFGPTNVAIVGSAVAPKAQEDEGGGGRNTRVSVEKTSRDLAKANQMNLKLTTKM